MLIFLSHQLVYCLGQHLLGIITQQSPATGTSLEAVNFRVTPRALCVSALLLLPPVALQPFLLPQPCCLPALLSAPLPFSSKFLCSLLSAGFLALATTSCRVCRHLGLPPAHLHRVPAFSLPLCLPLGTGETSDSLGLP